MRGLAGKSVLVTGASRGIGRGIALRFAEEGANVAVNHPGEAEEAREVVDTIRARGGTAFSVRADVAKAAQVRRMVERVVARFGQIDVLVNNAGVSPFYEFFDITEKVWDRTQAVNLKGVFLCSQAVARHMVDRRIPGRIVSTSSLSSYVGSRMQAHYCSSKAGVNLLMKSMAITLGPHGITCNSVLPGLVATKMNREIVDDPAIRRAYERQVPMRRLGQPQDMAAATAFLASDDARYITGAEILVDGGAFASFEWTATE